MAWEDVIRDPDFGRRFNQACAANRECPDADYGRYKWLVDQAAVVGKLKVSQESIRRYLYGINKPRKATSDFFAKLLGVDATWLYLGVDPGVATRERKVRNAEADGVVNVIAGLIQMDGGQPSFPAPDDVEANDRSIDVRAIIRGAHYNFHVTIAHKNKGKWEFPIPVQQNLPTILGVVRDGFALRVIEITDEVIEGHLVKRAAGRTVVLSDDDIEPLRLKSFQNRL